MNMIEGLVTDRSKSDVDHIEYLISKGIEGMTEDELAYFLRGSAIPAYAKDGALQNANGTIHCMDGVVKGAYNATDLNRVGAAVEYTAKRLSSLGYAVNVYPRTDWKSEDFPNASDAEAYLSNISELRGAISMPEETPSVPVDLNGFTYSEANNIEQILKIIEDSINRMVDANIYCGEFCGGEV